jgi:hypothetical protein
LLVSIIFCAIDVLFISEFATSWEKTIIEIGVAIIEIGAAIIEIGAAIIEIGTTIIPANQRPR